MILIIDLEARKLSLFKFKQQNKSIAIIEISILSYRNMIAQLATLQWSEEFQTSQDIFEKYRAGVGIHHLPFKLFQDAAVETTPQEIETVQPARKRNKNGVRGPYRRYSKEQKQDIIDRMLNGCTLRKLAQETLIPKRNLIRWKHEFLHKKSVFNRKSSIQTSAEECRSQTRMDREWIETKESISEECLDF